MAWLRACALISLLLLGACAAPGDDDSGLTKTGAKADCAAEGEEVILAQWDSSCLLYTSPSPRDKRQSRMPSSA